MLDELSEPGIVGVTAQIPGLDVALPEAGDEEKDGDEREEKKRSSRKMRHFGKVSITRMRKKK